MLEFLIWVYILSLVIVGPLIAYDIYTDWKRGNNVYLSDLAKAFIVASCPGWNTIALFIFIRDNIQDIVVFPGKDQPKNDQKG